MYYNILKHLAYLVCQYKDQKGKRSKTKRSWGGGRCKVERWWGKM